MRPSERCSIDHAALKADDAAWNALDLVGFQEDYDDDGNRSDLELRNCACRSTLCRPARRR